MWFTPNLKVMQVSSLKMWANRTPLSLFLMLKSHLPGDHWCGYGWGRERKPDHEHGLPSLLLNKAIHQESYFCPSFPAILAAITCSNLHPGRIWPAASSLHTACQQQWVLFVIVATSVNEEVENRPEIRGIYLLLKNRTSLIVFFI